MSYREQDNAGSSQTGQDQSGTGSQENPDGEKKQQHEAETKAEPSEARDKEA